MAKNRKNKPLFGGFDRLQDFPLDSSSIFDTWAELEEYRLHSKIAYHGQLVVCLDSTSDHYGAYILQEKGNSTSYLYPYKLAGAKEFTDQIASIRNEVIALDTRLTTLSDTEIAQIRETLNKAKAWIQAANEDGEFEGTPIFASKQQLETLENELNKNITKIYAELYGESFADRLIAIEQYGGKVDSIYEFIEDHAQDFESVIDSHSNRIQNAESLIANHSLRLTQAEEIISDLLIAFSALSEIRTILTEHKGRIAANERSIRDINTKLQSIEYIAEYNISSLPIVSAPEFNTDTIIKEIELIIDETGANVTGGYFSSDTKMSIKLISSTNPQNVTDTIVSKDEIFLSQDVKIILDMDYQVPFKGNLSFITENSEGLSGRAYVKYFIRPPREAPRYSVNVNPISGIEIIGEGAYEANEKVVINFIPKEGYYIETTNAGAQALVNGRYFPIQLNNGIYTLSFDMINVNLTNIITTGIYAIANLSSVNNNGGA